MTEQESKNKQTEKEIYLHVAGHGMCKLCEYVKPLKEFYTNGRLNKQKKLTYKAYCKDCSKTISKQAYTYVKHPKITQIPEETLTIIKKLAKDGFSLLAISKQIPDYTYATLNRWKKMNLLEDVFPVKKEVAVELAEAVADVVDVAEAVKSKKVVAKPKKTVKSNQA
jgi:hypothetical protein